MFARKRRSEGMVLVNAMHITASVFINDDESGLHHDYGVWLEKLAPHEPIKQYRHNDTGEDNANAHIKRQVMGREVIVAITDGKLDLRLEPRPWPEALAQDSAPRACPWGSTSGRGSRSFTASSTGGGASGYW